MQEPDMTHRPPDYDPKSIWQSQTPEEPVMSLHEVQRKARELKIRLRQGGILFLLATVLQILLGIVENWLGVKNAWWAGLINFSLVTAAIFYFPYMLAYREPWPLSITSLGTVTGVDFYRKQLERQIDWFRDPSLRRSLIAFLAFAFALNSIVYPRLIPLFSVLVVVWVFFFYRRKNKELPELESELGSLRAFRRDNL
jgi:hypothetical protein